MMTLTLNRCFADPEVSAVMIDPLASNTRAINFYHRCGMAPDPPGLGEQCPDRRNDCARTASAVRARAGGRVERRFDT